jgi:cytochrome b561
MSKYTVSMRILHWVMSILVLTLLAVGFWMASLPSDYPGLRDIFNLHKSFGVIVFILIILRVANRLMVEVPALPREITKFYANLSAIIIFTLYVCMVMQPISGYLMSTYSGRQVMLFSLPIPSLVEKNESLAKFFFEMHVSLGISLVVLTSLHILGTIKHYIVDKTNLLKRIW